eukprot:8595840-Pyramimonas_sp.AAC.1
MTIFWSMSFPSQAFRILASFHPDPLVCLSIVMPRLTTGRSRSCQRGSARRGRRKHLGGRCNGGGEAGA